MPVLILMSVYLWSPYDFFTLIHNQAYHSIIGFVFRQQAAQTTFISFGTLLVLFNTYPRWRKAHRTVSQGFAWTCDSISLQTLNSLYVTYSWAKWTSKLKISVFKFVTRLIFRTAWVGFSPISLTVSKQTYQLSPDSDSNWCTRACDTTFL